MLGRMQLQESKSLDTWISRRGAGEPRMQGEGEFLDFLGSGAIRETSRRELFDDKPLIAGQYIVASGCDNFVYLRG